MGGVDRDSLGERERDPFGDGNDPEVKRQVQKHQGLIKGRRKRLCRRERAGGGVS